MIHFLKGLVEEIGEDYVSLDVGGVGYKVHAPSRLLGQLTQGEAVKIHTFTYVREDIFALYGFTEQADRALFEKLMSVSGVGAKMAMAMLSALSGGDIAAAISNGDTAVLTQANGVGKKLAERLILELKGKMEGFGGSNVTSISGSSGGAGPTPQSANSDVLSALINMGFKAGQAQQALAVAVDKEGSDAEFGALLKSSLQALRSA